MLGSNCCGAEKGAGDSVLGSRVVQWLSRAGELICSFRPFFVPPPPLLLLNQRKTENNQLFGNVAVLGTKPAICGEPFCIPSQPNSRAEPTPNPRHVLQLIQQSSVSTEGARLSSSFIKKLNSRPDSIFRNYTQVQLRVYTHQSSLVGPTACPP